MAVSETENPRILTSARSVFHRLAFEWLVLAAASLAFLFSLGIAFGLISG